MKILKYVLFALLGLVALFFILGLLKSSVSYGHEIIVDKSIKEAWAVSQDESKYAQWLQGFKSIELIEGKKGEVGSKYKVIVNPGEGQDDFEMIETVASVKEFEHVTLDFVSDLMDFKQTIYFTESNGSTKIKSDSKVMGKGIVSRSMFAVMEMLAGAFSKQEAKNFDALKKLIDDNKTDYYPASVKIE